jgi:hypothetical protein
MTRSVQRGILALAMSICIAPAWAGGDPFLFDSAQHKLVYAESADVVRVTIDFAKLLVLDRPASTIVIGNTAIAGANLSDERTLILTGKTAGATNLIVIDADGTEVANLILEVVAGGTHLVTVHQGVRRQTFTCAGRCDPVLSVGDDAELFTTTASQIEARHGFADVDGGAQ